MVIIWLPEARSHLKEIYLFHKENRSLKIAVEVRLEIYSSVTILKKFPQMASIEVFSSKTTKEYRSLVVSKYFKVVYYIDEEKIYVSAIFDCRQAPETNVKKIKE